MESTTPDTTSGRPGSVEAVAQTLIVEPDPAPTPDEQPQEHTPEEPTLEEQATTDSEEVTAETETEEEVSEEPGNAEEPAGDEVELIEVKIDGEIHEVPLDDLVSQYSGNAAIAKRLQEATEAKKAAESARDLAIEAERTEAKLQIDQERETLRNQANQLAQIYTTYREGLMAPQVEPPAPELQQSDPLRYLTQVEAYRQDQERLRAQQAHMDEVVTKSQQMNAEAQAERARSEAQAVLREVPAMKDPEYRKQAMSRINEMATSLGFTEDEIRGAIAADRRMLYVGLLAAERVGDIKKVMANGNVAPKPQKAPPRAKRVRRSNGQFAKQREASQLARKTGSVEDVAASLIVPRKPGARR